MTVCGLNEGILIEFPRANLTIRPIDVDFRIQKRHYARGAFDITEQAAKSIDALVRPGDRAIVKADGNDGYRMMFPEDGLEYEETLDEKTIGKLPLLDGRKVLRRGSVDEAYGVRTPVTDMIDDVVSKAHDPDNVITGTRFITDGKTLTVLVDEFGDVVKKQWTEDITPNSPELLGTISRKGDYNFDGETPLEVLNQLTSDLMVSSWVDLDGVLNVGLDRTRAKVVGTSTSDNNLVMSRYTVTRDAKTTNAVQVRGPMDSEKIAEGTGLQPISEASVPGSTGELKVMEGSGAAGSLDTLENTAVRALLQETAEDVSGSIEINGLASEAAPRLIELTVGDRIGIDSSIETDCKENVTTGLFMITDIHHRASAERGWDVNMKVSKFLDPANVKVKSVFYDPETDKDYESLEQYRQAQEDEEEDDELDWLDFLV